jgi:hypothetical protein
LEAPAFHRVLEALPEKASVGVYPTSRCDLAVLRDTVERLRRNPAVEDYFVKPHPNSATQFSGEESEFLRVRSEIPDERHVAITGNSSVVLELLRRGHPVFQLFSLDAIKPDYYSFVRNGLASSIEAVDLEQAFWCKGSYGKDWLQRVSGYDPSVREDQSRVRRRLARFVRRLLLRRRLGEVIRDLVGRNDNSSMPKPLP